MKCYLTPNFKTMLVTVTTSLCLLLQSCGGEQASEVFNDQASKSSLNTSLLGEVVDQDIHILMEQNKIKLS